MLNILGRKIFVFKNVVLLVRLWKVNSHSINLPRVWMVNVEELWRLCYILKATMLRVPYWKQPLEKNWCVKESPTAYKIVVLWLLVKIFPVENICCVYFCKKFLQQNFPIYGYNEALWQFYIWCSLPSRWGLDSYSRLLLWWSGMCLSLWKRETRQEENGAAWPTPPTLC